MSFDVFVWFDHRLGFPKTGFLQRIIGHIGYMGPYPSILRSFRSENTEEPSRTVGRHASGGVTQHQRGLLRFIGCVWRLSTQKGQRLTGGVASHFQRILSNGGQIRRLCDVGIMLKTVEQMSKISGIGENKLRELMDSGELEYIQNGNRRLIADAAIWDWYHRAKTTAKPPARQGG